MNLGLLNLLHLQLPAQTKDINVQLILCSPMLRPEEKLVSLLFDRQEVCESHTS